MFMPIPIGGAVFVLAGGAGALDVAVGDGAGGAPPPPPLTRYKMVSPLLSLMPYSLSVLWFSLRIRPL